MSRRAMMARPERLLTRFCTTASVLVMRATNNDKLKALMGRVIPKRKGAVNNG